MPCRLQDCFIRQKSQICFATTFTTKSHPIWSTKHALDDTDPKIPVITLHCHGDLYPDISVSTLVFFWGEGCCIVQSKKDKRAQSTLIFQHWELTNNKLTVIPNREFQTSSWNFARHLGIQTKMSIRFLGRFVVYQGFQLETRGAKMRWPRKTSPSAVSRCGRRGGDVGVRMT